MNYPNERKGEDVVRLCPYCHRPFDGYQGVMIHLGQIAGKHNHPEDAAENIEKDDLPVAHVDENQNVVEIIDGGDSNLMPTTEVRRLGQVDAAKVNEFIDWLKENGHDDAAEKAVEMLF